MIRKIILVSLVILIGAGIVLFVLPFIVSSQMVREEVASQISELTGRAVTLRGDQALQVFPNLSVELSDVVIDGDRPGPENALIVAETLRGSVQFWPLLFGRVELSAFELTRPTINLQRDEEGIPNWTLNGSALLTALEPASRNASGLELGTFRIIDGTVRYSDARLGTSETVSSANIALAWPRSSTRAVISGSAIWRGEAVELSASLDQPAALAQTGSTSGVVVSLVAAPLRMRFDGTVSPGQAPQLSADQSTSVPGVDWQAAGQLELSSPSLRRAASWLGREMAAGSTFGAFRVDADLNLVGDSADLTDAMFSLDGNEAEGVLTLSLGSAMQRPSIQGTLDFERFDVSAYLDSIRPTTTASAPDDWRFYALPNVFSLGADMDVRFATRQILAAPLTLGETAGSILLSDTRLVIGLGEAIAYGGSLRGSVTLDKADDGLATRIDLSADDIRLSPMLAAYDQEPRLAGSLTFRTNIAASGQTMDEWFQSMQGEARMRLDDGVLGGFDVDAVMLSLVDGSFDLASFGGGETPIEQFQANLRADAGYVEVDLMQFASTTAQVTLAGQSHIGAQSLAFAGAATMGTPSAENPQTDVPFVIIPFELGGTWSSPMLLPDLGALESASPQQAE